MRNYTFQAGGTSEVWKMNFDEWKYDSKLRDDLLKYVSQNLRRKEILDFVRRDFSMYKWSISTSGVTEQCGALSQSSGSGPLFFCKSRLQAEIALNCVNLLQRYVTSTQHQLTSTKQLLKYKIRLNRRFLGSFILSTGIIIEFIITILV